MLESIELGRRGKKEGKLFFVLSKEFGE